jgi:hypothetical protein
MLAGEIVFYDSNTNKPLFHVGRNTMEDFLVDSRNHGWLTFSSDHVKWEHVKVLDGGHVVSVDGTYLGLALPEEDGSRTLYQINIVSVAGYDE